MTVIARALAFELFKAGLNTSTKIRKQLLTEGEDIRRPTIENWRRRDKWDATGSVDAIKAVAKQVRKGKDIATRVGQTQPDSEAMRGSISNALNELGAVACEGAQALRAIIPSVVDEIKTVAEFNWSPRSANRRSNGISWPGGQGDERTRSKSEGRTAWQGPLGAPATRAVERGALGGLPLQTHRRGGRSGGDAPDGALGKGTVQGSFTLLAAVVSRTTAGLSDIFAE
jgi:hypothetical protein